MAENWDLDEHWKIINSGGTQVSLTPELWWKQATDYFKWCDEHPIKAKRTLTSGKTQGEKVIVEYNRPYSIKGMCLHCGISEKYLRDIQESNIRENEWCIVAEKILYIIYTNNLEGAIVDLYNPIMVSKVLNMDKPSEDNNTTVRVEIVNPTGKELAGSENEVLKNLDLEKVGMLKLKAENPKREITKEE